MKTIDDMSEIDYGMVALLVLGFSVIILATGNYILSNKQKETKIEYVYLQPIQGLGDVVEKNAYKLIKTNE